MMTMTSEKTPTRHKAKRHYWLREDFKELLQKAQATDGEKLRQAAQDMEGVFLKQLVEQMWRTIPKESRGQQAYYEGLFLEELAKILGETGGIGLADFIVKEMEK